jgi:dihydroorotase
MTLYLTDTTPPDEIARAKRSGQIVAVKLYPAGATTNSASGVTDIRHCHDTLREMAALGMPLLLHGEVTDADIDVFDREAVFIDRQLKPLLDAIPDLRLVMEHITTAEAVKFVRQAGDRLAATITPQHIRYDRNALFQGGLRPHLYCLPVLKRERHRQAVLAAATSGEASFFLGTDSAPHPRNAKQSGCGCAGIYSAHAAIELYADSFEQAGALDRLEGFASHHGADFYRLPRNSGTITLEKTPWTVPDSYPFGEQKLVPLEAGASLGWRRLPAN